MATTLAKISIKDNSTWNTYLNLIYPVGSVYFSYTSTSPADRFGGTWSSISNKFIYTGGVSTGGSTTHVHKLDAYGGANIDLGPNEAGSALIISHNYKRTAAQNAKVDKMTNPEVNTYNMGTTGTASEKHTEPVTLTGQTNTNIDTSLPPYQQVYCWRRTA